jgi:hypothetical protein
MIEKTTDFIPMWMVFSAAFGFLVGEAYGDLRRHRKCLQQTNDELRDRLQETVPDAKPIQRALKEQRGVINDIHRRLLAVSKGLEKHPS